MQRIKNRINIFITYEKYSFHRSSEEMLLRSLKVFKGKSSDETYIANNTGNDRQRGITTPVMVAATPFMVYSLIINDDVYPAEKPLKPIKNAVSGVNIINDDDKHKNMVYLKFVCIPFFKTSKYSLFVLTILCIYSSTSQAIFLLALSAKYIPAIIPESHTEKDSINIPGCSFM